MTTAEVRHDAIRRENLGEVGLELTPRPYDPALADRFRDNAKID